MKSANKICKFCEAFDDGRCSAKCLEELIERVATAIHREHNRNEGVTDPWICLYEFQRIKYRNYAYVALLALGRINGKGKMIEHGLKCAKLNK